MRAAGWSNFEEWRANAAAKAKVEGIEHPSRLECPYCNAQAQLVTGAVIYPNMPALHASHYHHCAPCDAYVGCHPGSTVPLGTMADKRLRLARKNAHAVFDPIWRTRVRFEGVPRSTARQQAYEWLAEELKIEPASCHIAHMGIDDCLRVISLCERLFRQRRQQAAAEQKAQPTRRAWVDPELRKPEARV